MKTQIRSSSKTLVTPIKLCYRKTMIQSSSTLEIAAPLWLILLITCLRVSATSHPFPPEPHQKWSGLCAIRFFVITKVSCLGTDSPTVLDIQSGTCWTKVNFYISVAVVCALFSGGGQGLCGFAKQHVSVLEFASNESLQSPQWKAPALILFVSLS